MRKYVAEFIGTFFLVLTIVCSVMLSGTEGGKGIIPPLAIGSALMVMIFAGGHISGAHFNPAVTIAVTLRGRCSKADVPGYWIAQFAGGIAAAFLARYVLVGQAPAEPPLMQMIPALVAEFLFTFALCYVVLNVATSKGTEGNSFYGLAIGFTVLTGAFAVGSISGGAFNPAVAVSLTLIKLGIQLGQVWIHLVAEVAAGIAAGTVFLFLNPDDK